MKKNIICLFTLLILTSQIFALAGFGLNLNQSLFNADESKSDLLIGSEDVGDITQKSFSNGLGLGGYLYIDAIPFIDLDIEGGLNASKYDFILDNLIGSKEGEFGWVAGSYYVTAKKKLFQLKIPFLAKAKLTAGLGFNGHSSTPMINQTMLEDVMGGPEMLEEGRIDMEELATFIKKQDKIASKGIHVQGGLQFKVLMFDSFLFYRQIIADDLIPGKKGLGSINLRLGMGF